MNSDDPNYVGYGNPPLGQRFQPGQSGNRKGRPKKRNVGADLDSQFLRGLHRKVQVDGKKVKLSSLLATAIVKAAVNGVPSALDYLRAIGAPIRLLEAGSASADSPARVEAQYQAVRAAAERSLVDLRARLRELNVDDRLITAALGVRGYIHAETVARRAAAIEQIGALGVPEEILQQLRAQAERQAGQDRAILS